LKSKQQFDAIVIGTGQAGPTLTSRLAGAALRVAVVERGRFGGTCVNTGCIPTKAMVASAYAAHLARRGAEYGVHTGAVSVDMKAVHARKARISAASREGLEGWLKGMANVSVFEGHGRLEGPNTVRVGEDLLEAPRIFLNVGGRAFVPPIAGLESVPFLTNASMMDVDYLPEHLLILGGSYIGLEFGQMFRRFGSQVTIFEPGPRLLSREDADVSAAILEILEAEGIEVRLNARVDGVRREGDSILIDAFGLRGSHLLVATGRRPNTDDLGLERADVATDARGYITVDEELRTNVEGIWALGDCNGRGAFTHTSYNDYEIVAGNLLGGASRRVSDRIPAYALYIDPPLGRVGLSEAQVRATGRPAKMAIRPMTRVGRAVEKGETRGLLKILVDGETEQILGASLLGTGCDEVVHSILDIMYAKASYKVIQEAMHIHPTVSELIPTLLGDLKWIA
jgi:pyruvate/2-oxoglutarate dehydrogenase complex dihydrolipoamide dehydrogenase (E3) component